MESDIQDSQALAQSPGQQLQQAREAAGMTVAYVADQLRLTENYILWLEADQYESLPSEPFVLGYFRGYARILGQSADELIESYRHYRQQLKTTVEQVTAPARMKTHEVLEEAVDTEEGGSNTKYLVAVVALVAIWILVSVLSGGEESTSTEPAPNNSLNETVSEEIAAEPLTATETVSDSVESELGQALEPLVGSSAVSPPASEVVAAPVNEPSVAETTAVELATPIHSTTNGLDQLVMQFSDECWLEVTDANGDVVAADLYQAGETANLQGVAPFRVMFGNVRVVTVELNGESVETKPRGFRKTLRTLILADGTTAPVE